jgi:acyl carrier protein
MNTTVDKSGIAARSEDHLFMKSWAWNNPQSTPSASFTNDLGLDSLDVLETFMALEKEFGLKINDEDAEKLTTVGAVTDYIIAHVH